MDLWFTCTGNGETFGPYSFDQLLAWARRGEVPSDMKISHAVETRGQWVDAASNERLWNAMQVAQQARQQEEANKLLQQQIYALNASQVNAAKWARYQSRQMTGGDRLVAFLASLFIPGFGQLIYGRPILAVFFFFGTAIGFLLILTSNPFGLFGLALPFLSCIHAVCMNEKR